MNSSKLFKASCIALVATSMTFAIRAGLLGTLGKEFELSNEEIGKVAGTAFWGFTLAMIFGGPLCDVLGMGKLLLVAFVTHVLGITLTIFATGFWSLFISTLLVGIGNGMVEAACNPLIATLYPDQKTEKLNNFHMWFPGGMAIGGLLAYFMTRLGLNWKYQMATILVPTLMYGSLFFKQSFPKTERVSSGISTLQMCKSCLSPLFIFMVCCMFLTSATELGTNQWIAELLENVGVPAILLLVFVNVLMAVGRSLAGPVVHKLSVPGVLLFSAIFASVGLFLLSISQGYLAFGAATIFAIGICYFWPTMIGFVAENCPKTGALGMSIMGGAGMLSVSLILPFMGDLYDQFAVDFSPVGYPIEVLKKALVGTKEFELWSMAKLEGGKKTLRVVAFLPMLLSILFTILFLSKSVWAKKEIVKEI